MDKPGSGKKFLRKEKLKKISVIGAEVLLPFDEEGIVVDYRTLLWGFPFIVKITKSVIFNDIGDKVDFKREQIIFKDKELNNFF